MMRISVVVGRSSAERSYVEEAINRIAKLVEHEVAESGSLDIVFHVAGPVWSPEYEGVRTGTFWKKRRTLHVQIAIPADLDRSGDQASIERTVLGMLREAVRMARPPFERAGIPFRHQDYEELINRAERAIGPH